jgi:hypothetical protein
MKRPSNLRHYLVGYFHAQLDDVLSPDLTYSIEDELHTIFSSNIAMSFYYKLYQPMQSQVVKEINETHKPAL